MTDLEPGGHADVTGPGLEQVRTRHLEVPQEQLGLRLALGLVEELVQLVPVVAATAERVVGARGRVGQGLLEQRHAHRILRILDLGLGVQRGAFPVETVVEATQARQRAHLGVVDLDTGRALEAIAGDGHRHAVRADVQALQTVRIERAVRQVHRAERVPVVVRGNRHRQRSDGIDAVLQTVGARVVQTGFAEE
ncbi:hypothetical protein D3C71_1321000 [compost metagenome]